MDKYHNYKNAKNLNKIHSDMYFMLLQFPIHESVKGGFDSVKVSNKVWWKDRIHTCRVDVKKLGYRKIKNHEWKHGCHRLLCLEVLNTRKWVCGSDEVTHYR